ncbi:MAG: 2Fe-2S iron-sulfur cluster-binding protein [bacterium]|nr:2Fe-2S iron-sulfur cluster-binding protein [bacterium]
MLVKFILNGKEVEFNIKPYEVLLDTLRNNGIYSVKRGCETGDCGSCVVLMEGKPVPSCMVFTAKVEGLNIVTVEGIGDIKSPHKLQKEFAQTAASQCGFCTPGIIMTMYSMLQKNKPNRVEEVKEMLNGNLCRCGSYKEQIDLFMKLQAYGSES